MERKMSDKTSAQIFVAMNEDGAFECATAADDAAKIFYMKTTVARCADCRYRT